MIRQCTIKKDVGCMGIGLHSGKKTTITLKPAAEDFGIKFRMVGYSQPREIDALLSNVVDTNFSTSIGSNGTKVQTIEHLLATLLGMGIDNLLVEIDGPEVPIMDGSAAPFVYLIKSAGIKLQNRYKKFLVIKKPIFISENNKDISLLPSQQFKISYTIDFQHPLISDQSYNIIFSPQTFIKEISKARTFGFLRDVEWLQRNGLALGGSLENAIVVNDFRIINSGELRYTNEFVRHKILDVIGDLYLFGMPVIGHLIANKSGHCLNNKLVKKVIQQRDAWEVLEPKRKPKTEEFNRFPSLELLEALS